MKISRIEINRKIFLYTSMGIAFFLSVSVNVLSYIILIMTLNWLSEGRFRMKFILLFKEKKRFRIVLLSSLYLFYLIGMCWSENQQYGWFDLEIKFSLLLFPLIFATSDLAAFTEKQRNKILWSLIAGCFTGMMILLFKAGYEYYRFRLDTAFYYTALAGSMHGSYLSMYIDFAVCSLGLYLFDKGRHFKRIVIAGIVLLILFFITMIFLLSSKAGVIGLLISVLVVSYYVMRSRKDWKMSLGVLMAGLSLLYAGFLIFPNAATRFDRAKVVIEAHSKNISTKQNESNAERLQVWKTAIEIIRMHPFLGVGTGDVKDALMDQYRLDGSFIPNDLRLNAHNQYLQTFVALGIPGILLLFSLFLFPSIQSVSRHDYFYLAFLLIFFFNILVESMLERQAGVIYFAFFNTFLFAVLSHKSAVSDLPDR